MSVPAVRVCDAVIDAVLETVEVIVCDPLADAVAENSRVSDTEPLHTMLRFSQRHPDAVPSRMLFHKPNPFITRTLSFNAVTVGCPDANLQILSTQRPFDEFVPLNRTTPFDDGFPPRQRYMLSEKRLAPIMKPFPKTFLMAL